MYQMRSITFDSQPGANYALDFTTNLLPTGNDGGWAELSDSVMSQGNTTTYEDLELPGANFENVYYRIRLLP